MKIQMKFLKNTKKIIIKTLLFFAISLFIVFDLGNVGYASDYNTDEHIFIQQFEEENTVNTTSNNQLAPLPKKHNEAWISKRTLANILIILASITTIMVIWVYFGDKKNKKRIDENRKNIKR